MTLPGNSHDDSTSVPSSGQEQRQHQQYPLYSTNDHWMGPSNRFEPGHLGNHVVHQGFGMNSSRPNSNNSLQQQQQQQQQQVFGRNESFRNQLFPQPLLNPPAHPSLMMRHESDRSQNSTFGMMSNAQPLVVEPTPIGPRASVAPNRFFDDAVLSPTPLAPTVDKMHSQSLPKQPKAMASKTLAGLSGVYQREKEQRNKIEKQQQQQQQGGKTGRRKGRPKKKESDSAKEKTKKSQPVEIPSDENNTTEDRRKSRGRQRRRSSKQANEHESGSDEETLGYGFLSIKHRKTRNRQLPQTQLVVVNDEEPNRLTNPLLAMVPANFRKSQNHRQRQIQRDLQQSHCRRGSKQDSENSEVETIQSPSLKATGTIPVEEFMNSASLVFHRPDTYPLSFLARLLGFDVDVPDAQNLFSEEVPNLPQFPSALPKELAFRKDNVFLKVPPEGIFYRKQALARKNLLGDLDDQIVLDYMDPIYRCFLQDGWDPSRSFAVPRIKCMKFITEQKPQETLRHKVASMAQKLLGLSKDWTFSDWGSFQMQWQKHPEAGKDARKPLWTIDGDHVFSHMPQQIFGVLALYKGEPVVLLKYQFFWYPVHTKTESTEGRQDELIMQIHGFASRTTKAEKPAKASSLASGTSREEHQPSTKENSLPKPNDLSLQHQNHEETTEDQTISLPTVEISDAVKIVMLSMALEHTRACGIFYGLWETPLSDVEANQNCFRMVVLPQHKTATTSTNLSETPSVANERRFSPMICDLKKCSSRLALLKLQEKQNGKARPSGRCEESSSERLLVQMPTFEKANTFFNGVSQKSSRQSKRGLDGDSGSTRIFTGAHGEAREVSLKLRATILEKDMKVCRVDSSGETAIPNRSQGSVSAGNEEEKESLSSLPHDDGSSSNNNNSEAQHETDIPWKLLRCFPIEGTARKPQEEENEILNELTRKQDELVAMEKSLEPHLRKLLAKVVQERTEYELPESRQRRIESKETLERFKEHVLKRKEIDQVREEMREEDMDAVCSICKDGDVTPDNQILFCESCNVAIHQQCYGVEKIPEGDYYCIACRHHERDKIIEALPETSRFQARAELPPLPIVCELCPFKYGAFTRVQTPGSTPDAENTKWIHMTCAKWQGLDFVVKGDASLVEDVTLLKQYYRRKNISCYICKGMRGAYTQCREEGCENWCHITCARESGLCEVVHGEDVKGVPIAENPWTIRCPLHSKVDKTKKNIECINELIKNSKELPTEPMPPPLLTDLAPYNKLTGPERKMALSVKEYEEKYIADILKTKLAGVRCEVCDIIEDIHGRNLCRCEDCGTVVCHTCELFSENPGQRTFKCSACRARSSKDCEIQPQCIMCNQKGGLLVKSTASPVIKQGYWNKNPKEFERSLFKKTQWAHVLCAYWLKDVVIDYDAQVVNLSNVIAANGRHFVLNGSRCGLCGIRGGYKTKCATGRCHAHGELNKPYHFHATCARQIGFEVAHNDDEEFVVNCYAHGSNENNLRARLEDLIETEKKRAGKDFSRADAPMKFSDGSKLLHGAIMVMRILGWAWRWAEWWVEYGSTWEPLLEEGEDESQMTAQQLRIIESSKESRRDDARRCRLSAFGAALRNRCYDTEDGYNNEALERALRAILHTQSLVGPLQEYEIDFFTDLLGRAYRSRSRLLGFGADKIPVAREAFCLHIQDGSPKFELGNRSLPGKTLPPSDEVFEKHVEEPDDFLNYSGNENPNLLDEIDYKYKGNPVEDGDSSNHTLMAVVDTKLLDRKKSSILRQHTGRVPGELRLQIMVKIQGKEFNYDDSESKAKGSGSYKSDEALMKFDTDGFRPLNTKKVEFLQSVGIKSVAEFMKTPTIQISSQYCTWREEKRLPPLKDAGSAGNTLNKWKSDTRKYYSQFIEKEETKDPETTIESPLDTQPESPQTSSEPLRESKEYKDSQDPSDDPGKAALIDESNASNDIPNASGDIPEAEKSRTSKRSRTSTDDLKSKEENQKQEGEEEKSEEQPRSKRTRFTTRRYSAGVSFNEGNKEEMKSPNSVTRPRRNNSYRDGSLKEVEEENADEPSDDPEPKSEVILQSPGPVKRKRGRPKRSTPESKKKSKPLGIGLFKRPIGRPPKRDKFFSALPEEAAMFLKSINVRNSKEFLSAKTSSLASTYPKFREETNQKPLKGIGAAAKLSTWKRIVRDAALAEGDLELASLGYNRTSTAGADASDDEGNDDKCAICNDGGDLLLCDGCDKAYHTNCVGLSKVPDGEWFCPDCHVDDDDKCAICNDVGELIICDGCENAYHPSCVDLKEVPEDDWFCPECAIKDDDKCAICGDVGELILCDGCEKAYHIACVKLDAVPEGEWFCSSCKNRDP